MGISLALLAEGLAQGLGGAGQVLQQQQMQQQEQERQRQMDSERRMLALDMQRERAGERERQAGIAGLFSRGIITAPELAAIPEGAQPGDIERLMATLNPEQRAAHFGQRQEAMRPSGPSTSQMMAARRQALAEYQAMNPANPLSGLAPPITEEDINMRAKRLLGIEEPPQPMPMLPQEADTSLFDNLQDEIRSGGDDSEIRKVMNEARGEGRITPAQHELLREGLSRRIREKFRPSEEAQLDADMAERQAWLDRALEARRKKR